MYVFCHNLRKKILFVRFKMGSFESGHIELLKMFMFFEFFFQIIKACSCMWPTGSFTHGLLPVLKKVKDFLQSFFAFEIDKRIFNNVK